MCASRSSGLASIACSTAWIQSMEAMVEEAHRDFQRGVYDSTMGRLHVVMVLVAGCGGGTDEPIDTGTDPDTGPPAGNPDGTCLVPAGGDVEDVSTPTAVIGDGTPASCTSDAVVAAVAGGGVITFDCGPDP